MQHQYMAPETTAQMMAAQQALVAQMAHNNPAVMQ
jgi:hypothetical protein